jgi:hypothetical protein
MSMQPYTGRQLVTVEARGEGGKLRFDCEQPPLRLLRCTFDTLYQEFFRANPDAVGDWDSLRAWLSSKSWSVRQVTW